MFRHSKKTAKADAKNQSDSKTKNDRLKKDKDPIEANEEGDNREPSVPSGQISQADIQELLEKNLKWSQIIYEQNRKINRKLIWAAVAGWIKLFLIITPLVLGILYLSPFLKQAYKQYGNLVGIIGQQDIGQEKSQNTSLQTLMEILHLSPEQKKQAENYLK
ncbi:MAG: hypothetical protein COU31_03855 [Candidatus Magasanikbacteria bacterium CG10_big_fil_rev_8_21_14_0_10_40_10]|uniref:Uncharacterized protein n=1 Tax=Candidatus Magasanikbacteria bacterium CG10_big_fil_rev_8_21_14_0_10_40_10 TaxID=1974648 RepID=A0A2M6W3B2_9BACT|nr:MAG: hypothetical protein COU31_03855 [Candidatus Magasanikbacteria bacterium CG10_big_fil_rev_8_21_14_0_10_40_10]